MATQTKKRARVSRKTKTVAEKPALVYATGDQCFWACDGHILASLYDLEHALSCMEKDVYEHHVNSERNDFANWVEVILLDTDCGGALRKARGQKMAHRTVVKSLGRYIS